MHILKFFEDLVVTLIVVVLSVLLAIVITAVILSPAKADEPVARKYDAADLHLVKVSFNENIERGAFQKAQVKKTIDTSALDKVVADIVEMVKKPEVDYTLLKIITHEGGCDPVVCNLVSQALYNTCEKYNWQYSPLELAYKYQYASPLTWYSKEAEDAYRAVFIDGVRFPEIGEATVFYAPAYCTGSYHESQIFAYETHGVRFFKER